MRASFFATAIAAPLALGLLALSCKGFTGELLVAVQTDMSMPKDLDSIEIQVSVLGTLKYTGEFNDLGTPNATIKLPATLALLGPEKIGDPVKVRVIGRRNKLVRISRDVVTTVPEGRITTLPIKLEGLCLDFDSQTSTDDLVSNGCKDGETCIAGSCESNELSAEMLSDYEEGDIFGGGTGKGDGSCFDVTQCFIGADPLLRISSDPCTYEAPKTAGDFNVAILTEITGMCGAASCLVALDFGSASGWTRDENGNVALPKGICDPTIPNAALGVVFAPVTAECVQKTLALPTCGAWSSSGPTPTVPEDPVLTPLATKQAHPVALVVADNDVYWANTGVPSMMPNSGPSLKRSSTEAFGVVSVLDTGLGSPRGIAVAGDNVFFTSIFDGDAPDEIQQIPRKYFVDPKGSIKSLIQTSSPDGIAALVTGPQTLVLWSEFSAGNVKMATSNMDGALVVNDKFTVSGLVNPLRVIANPKFVCWTVEGMLGSANGSISCMDVNSVGKTPVLWTSDLQETPRALALDKNGVVYWATFEKNGVIRRANALAMPDDTAGTILVDSQAYPNGLAVDSEAIYWTNWGDGTVWKQTLMAPETPTKLAEGQDRPSVIAVTDDAIFWINEGSSTEPTGSVMRLLKK